MSTPPAVPQPAENEEWEYADSIGLFNPNCSMCRDFRQYHAIGERENSDYYQYKWNELVFTLSEGEVEKVRRNMRKEVDRVMHESLREAEEHRTQLRLAQEQVHNIPNAAREEILRAQAQVSVKERTAKQEIERREQAEKAASEHRAHAERLKADLATAQEAEIREKNRANDLAEEVRQLRETLGQTHQHNAQLKEALAQIQDSIANINRGGASTDKGKATATHPAQPQVPASTFGQTRPLMRAPTPAESSDSESTGSRLGAGTNWRNESFGTLGHSEPSTAPPPSSSSESLRSPLPSSTPSPSRGPRTSSSSYHTAPGGASSEPRGGQNPRRASRPYRRGRGGSRRTSTGHTGPYDRRHRGRQEVGIPDTNKSSGCYSDGRPYPQPAWGRQTPPPTWGRSSPTWAPASPNWKPWPKSDSDEPRWATWGADTD